MIGGSGLHSSVSIYAFPEYKFTTISAKDEVFKNCSNYTQRTGSITVFSSVSLQGSAEVKCFAVMQN